MSIDMSSIKISVSNAGKDQNGLHVSFAGSDTVAGGSVQFGQDDAARLGINLGGLVVVFDLDNEGRLVGIEVV